MSSGVKRILVLLVAVVIMGALMSGCGGSSGTDNAGGTGSLSGSGK